MSEIEGDAVDGAAATPQINAAAVKLPPFWEGAPEAWFRRVEAKFRLNGIVSSRTKADHVLSNLEEKIGGSLGDVGEAGSTPYEDVKAALIGTCGKSKAQRVAEILDTPDLGNERPSLLVSRLCALKGDDMTLDDVLRAVFLRSLPGRVRLVLENDTDNIQGLGKKADAFFTHAGVAINATSSTVLDAPMADLSLGASSSAVNVSSRPPVFNKPAPRRDDWRRNNDQRPSRSLQGGGDVERVTLCRFHARWGAKAYQCEPPCHMASGNDQAGSRS